MNSFSKILIFLIALPLLSSCGTTGYLPRSELKEISKALDIKVRRSDNIKLFKSSADWMGVKYRYGGNTRKGIDCSALVGNVIRSSSKKNLSRKASDIYKKNCRKISKFNLQSGDLVFFHFGRKKGRRRTIDHVGIYLKDDVFIHASISRGVTTDKLSEKYYKERLLHCGRVKR